ncbi:hypothetical protein SBOR_1333 [Sclerotinia borealis F-4128]|uniref:Uncharacterized protein n=1 Tax=Sclerotinia borealis (strain F-4128) TaxID=1432307 RepID=W9CN63_SCLBF|nr:hypothetical protein SBOR_1333 [Sclerotinia borealis F-4128]
MNAIRQSFLHVLDASRFSDDLINFLELFKDGGLLEQRDHNGQTNSTGQTAIQFSLRDNQGLSAAQHIRNVAQAQNPYASYGHVGHAQAIVVYGNIANQFIAQTEIPGNFIEETQNRVAVLKDRDGHTALYHAIRKGYCDCVAILLQHGAHEHLLAKDQEIFDKLQKQLAVVSALIACKAVLEPTQLQAYGVDPT